jgi:uncharacterized membrane protein
VSESVRMSRRPNGYDDRMDMGGAMAIIGILMMAAMLGLIGWGAIAAVRAARGSRERSARTVLDDRFAAGEIDEEEYERGRRVLEHSER